MIGGCLANAILTILISKKNINDSIRTTQQIINKRKEEEKKTEIKTESKTETAIPEIAENIDTMEWFIRYFTNKGENENGN